MRRFVRGGVLPVLATAAALLVLALALVTAAGARPATAVPGIRPVTYGGDTWWNYDFVTRGGTTDADWPIDVIFYGNATISKVYNRLGWFWPGSNVYEQVNDGSGFAWVASAGRKNALCTSTHLRLYADADGFLSDSGGVLGNYVIGTAHLDRNECGRTPTFGFNETAEDAVAARAVAVFGSAAVTKDAASLKDGTSLKGLLGNEIQQVYGNRTYANDGLPTLVRVP